MQLTRTTAQRVEQLPRRLRAEFSNVPPALIEHDVDTGVRRLLASAHFDDYVPLLVHSAVRERLRASRGVVGVPSPGSGIAA